MNEKAPDRIVIDFKSRIHEYETVFTPYKWWHWRALTDRWNWYEGSGYWQMMSSVWNNVLVFLTPWYKPFRHLLHTFCCKNYMKLLDDNRNFTCLRTRGDNQYYYTLRKKWLFWAELQETVWLDTENNNEQVNAFGAAILSLVNHESEEETERRYEERTRIVCRGFILTRSGCQRMMKRIEELTKDKIDWIF